MNEQMNDLKNEWMNEFFQECDDHTMLKTPSEWTDEWTNEWMNEFFQEFDDHRDAEDAVYELDGKKVIPMIRNG
jgi:hypothetical protein